MSNGTDCEHKDKSPSEDREQIVNHEPTTSQASWGDLTMHPYVGHPWHNYDQPQPKRHDMMEGHSQKLGDSQVLEPTIRLRKRKRTATDSEGLDPETSDHTTSDSKEYVDETPCPGGMDNGNIRKLSKSRTLAKGWFSHLQAVDSSGLVYGKARNLTPLCQEVKDASSTKNQQADEDEETSQENDDASKVDDQGDFQATNSELEEVCTSVMWKYHPAARPVSWWRKR